MNGGNCGPGFAWAFGARPENFGFDAGTFWGGRGKSRGGPFGGGRMFDQGHLKFVILRRSTIQVVDGRGRVVHRRRVDTNDARGIHLESRPELEPRHALAVDGHEV